MAGEAFLAATPVVSNSINARYHVFTARLEVSFSGLGFLAFYLAGKMHLFDHRGHVVSTKLQCSKLYADIACLAESVGSVDPALSCCPRRHLPHDGLPS